MAFRFVRMAVALAACVACACTPEPETPSVDDLLAARQAALDFDVRLKRDVLDRLERDEDPVAVYLSYRDHAPSFAREISERMGFEFSRVSLRPRNTASAADDWEREQIETFQFWREAGLDPAVMESAAIVVEGEGEGKTKVFRWMRPVAIDEPCMVCHGDAIDPRVLTLLAQEYPLDEATGYYETEIAGAYSVSKAVDEQ
jgi:hypothetical protein